MILSDKLQHALNDTLVLHRHQKRKGTEIPYASHPITLAMLLIDAKLDEDIVVAALLHDTIEDTSLEESELKAKYGQRVYDMVMACTEKDQSQQWEMRKKHTVSKFSLLSDDAKWIVLADKLHNLYSMSYQHNKIGDELWQFFSRGVEKQKWYYQSLLGEFKKVEAFKNSELLLLYEKLYIDLFED
jgi:(p)ppGpp synthase/HD superfamily hydrolase